MPERPSHIPPENPFGSQESKLPPEPTAKFVERYLGKKGARSAETAEPAAPDDLLSAEERAELVARKPEVASGMERLVASERDKLSEFFGYDLDVPPPPPDVTAERVEQWHEQGFALHYLPDVELHGSEPGLKTPLKFNYIEESKVDRYGPDLLKPLELPGAWVLTDIRLKPNYSDGTQKYSNDALIEAVVGGSRFHKSWNQLRKPGLLRPALIVKLASTLKVEPTQLRLPRMVEYNFLGNLHHPEWGTTSTSEWFEDSYGNRKDRLHGGNSGFGGLAHVKNHPPGTAVAGIGFRPFVVLASIR